MGGKRRRPKPRKRRPKKRQGSRPGSRPPDPNDPLALVRERARLSKRREFCRASKTLREACIAWNTYQFKLEKGGIVEPCWRDHYTKAKGLVEETMKDVSGDDHAVVLGAGICSEVPLRKMCEKFDKVTLVDIDPKSMEFAVSRMGSQELSKRIELLEADVSLIIEPLVEQVEVVLENSSLKENEAKEIIDALFRIAASNPTESRHIPVSEDSADLVISSNVMAFMLTMPITWIDVCFEKRFGESQKFDEKIDSQLLYSAVKHHIHDIGRIMKPEKGWAFVETCIANGPIYNNNVVVGFTNPQTGQMTYTGIPLFGHDQQVGAMVELTHLLRFMSPNMAAFRPSFDDWTIYTSGISPLMTPVGILQVRYGNVFQSYVLKKH